MLKIGEFSKLCQLPVKTLRYYDEIGLLAPTETDSFSGYRYYSPDQLPRLNRILALKDLGLSLDQVAQMLSDDLTAEQIRGMLKLKQAEVRQRLEDEQALLCRVEARLRIIEQEGLSMSAHDIVIKTAGPFRVAALRDIVPSYAHTGQLFVELMQHLGQSGVRPEAGSPCMAIYYDTEYKERDVDTEVCIGISRDIPGTERIKIRELPATTVACLIHQGPFSTLSETYGLLMPWIQANGYRIVGPNREVYLRGAESGVKPEEYLTEVQFPVAKA